MLSTETFPQKREEDHEALRTIRVTSWGLAGAVTLLVLVVASLLVPVRDAPLLRQISQWLPFA